MVAKKIPHLLKALSSERKRPDGHPYTSLTFSAECQIAGETGESLREVELQALKENIIPQRYCRNQTSLSSEDQIKLLQAHVAVIGLGGLGGTVTEILARIGVGKLTLIDGDCFDESNLNRQILSSPGNLGKPKADVAAERVDTINPAVETYPAETFITGKNGTELLRNVDLVVDCLDTITDRFTVESTCRELALPMVSAAIGGSSGQATVVLPGDPGLKLIYGTPGKAPARGIEATLGTLPFAAIYMAAVECAETVAILIGRSPGLQNRVFLADIMDHTAELVDFS